MLCPPFARPWRRPAAAPAQPSQPLLLLGRATANLSACILVQLTARAPLWPSQALRPAVGPMSHSTACTNGFRTVVLFATNRLAMQCLAQSKSSGARAVRGVDFQLKKRGGRWAALAALPPPPRGPRCFVLRLAALVGGRLLRCCLDREGGGGRGSTSS